MSAVGTKLISINKVLAKVDLKRTQFNEIVRKGLFPAPLELVPGGQRKWLESEVDDHIARRAAARNSIPSK